MQGVTNPWPATAILTCTPQCNRTNPCMQRKHRQGSIAIYQTCQQTTKQLRMGLSDMHAWCEREPKTDAMCGRGCVHGLALTKNLCLRSSAAVGRASGSLSKHLPTTSRSACNMTGLQFIHCRFDVLGTHRGRMLFMQMCSTSMHRCTCPKQG